MSRSRYHAVTLALGLAVAFVVAYAMPPAEAQTVRRLLTDTVNSNGDAASITIPRGITTATVEVTGTFSETLTFNVFGTTSTPVGCTPVAGGAAVSTATAVGKWVCPVFGWVSFNVTGSSFVSGAAIVRIQLAGYE